MAHELTPVNTLLRESDTEWLAIAAQRLRPTELANKVPRLLASLTESGRGVPDDDDERRGELEGHLRFWAAVQRVLLNEDVPTPQLARYAETQPLRDPQDLVADAIGQGIVDLVVQGIQWTSRSKRRHASSFTAEGCRFVGGAMNGIEVATLNLYESSLLGLLVNVRSVLEVDLRSCVLYDTILTLQKASPANERTSLALTEGVLRNVTFKSVKVSHLRLDSVIVVTGGAESQETWARNARQVEPPEDSPQLLAARERLRGLVDEARRSSPALPGIDSDASMTGREPSRYTVIFDDCEFSESASFKDSRLESVLFVHCTIANEDFRNANLDGSRFEDCVLSRREDMWEGVIGDFEIVDCRSS